MGILSGSRLEAAWLALPIRAASILRKSRQGLRLNEHLEHPEGEVVFRHACKMGLEGIVSKRLGSRYRSGRSPDWLKFKNPEAPAVRREAQEDWGC
jgi:bifunctional non-homologous end joining protein LigD